VAQYADACNVFGSPEMIARKYQILDEHCAAVGRDRAEIERSTLQGVNLATDGGRGESADQVVDRFGDLADAGAEHVIFSIPGVNDPARIAAVAEVIPALKAL
jgi:alkanesulfonate monooxygenase SsuD/methylene tetrahydromethanopterin reductase-like flavin-dependent oxidoreductase (luciferase family)